MRIDQALIKILVFTLMIQGIQAKHPDAVGRRGMVVSASLAASRAGNDILRRGGNAIDAAIATGFALAVTTPRAGNIGGGGFMVIRFADGTTTTIDFREKAPLAAGRDMYLDENGDVINGLSRNGILAAGVPGSVSGYGLASEKYGRLSWNDLLAPAIKLAFNGVAVKYALHNGLKWQQERLSEFEETSRIFYPNGAVLRLNQLFRQPDLAATLQRIADLGADEFYSGRTARLITRHMRERGGLITMDDLANYQAVERPALEFDYRDVHVISMGPPSSGGVVLAQILNALETLDLREMGYHSAAHIHAMVEAERRAYADRAYYLGDPDFVAAPIDELISDVYAQQRWSDVSPLWATDSDDINYGRFNVLSESNETTHFSVTDRWGNAVTVTTTINGSYGCGEVVKGAGFFLNNEMDDFSSKPGVPNMYGLIGSNANAIAPGKRMLSSMTPTIVTRNDSLLLLTGSPGGSTIITTVMQVISNVVDFDMDIKEAVVAPRIHHQWKPNVITIERYGIAKETLQRLTRMGHVVRTRRSIGAAQSIWVDPQTGWYHGAVDVRGAAGAVGY